MGSARTAPNRAAPVRPTKVRRRTEGSSSSLSPVSALSRPETAGAGKAGRVFRDGITGAGGALAEFVGSAAPDGRTFRPSMFVTLTCPSYGRVGSDGTPADPDHYDYGQAARDALHFAALFDRFIQNLRRFLGYDVQYFAAIEPQRRLAPHIHIAMRGTLSRTELRQVLAATYHQVWWPDTST
ncbi:MAG: replication initiator, partial [Trebonia sp.]